MARQRAAVASVPQSGPWPSVQVVCLRAGDIIVSVVVVLKSPFVDAEDFDRVVGAGTGKLDPGALLLDFTLSARLSIRLLIVVLSTYSAGPGPPAESLDRQGVALSAKGCVMKGNNRILDSCFTHCSYYCTISNS